MSSLARIVLPVDFSERSAGAARIAHALALHFRSEVILAHVLEPLFSDLGGMEITGVMLADVYHAREQQARRQLDAFALAQLGGAEVRRCVLNNEPASAIVKLAHEEQAGLIVMPTHGYGPFRRFILGSTTAKVLHDADCPVWTGVHLEAVPANIATFRKVLCALDLGSHSVATLAWAGWLAREFGAELTLIHAISTHPGPVEIEGAEWSGRREAAEQEILELQRDAAIDAQIVLETGDAPAVICSEAARIAADVLVIGRGSATGAIGRLRANAYAIIRQSPCPVASV